jgi:hypothetical protein
MNPMRCDSDFPERLLMLDEDLLSLSLSPSKIDASFAIFLLTLTKFLVEGKINWLGVFFLIIALCDREVSSYTRFFVSF